MATANKLIYSIVFIGLFSGNYLISFIGKNNCPVGQNIVVRTASGRVNSVDQWVGLFIFIRILVCVTRNYITALFFLYTV